MSPTMLQHMILEDTTWHYVALFETMLLWSTWEANQYSLDWSHNIVLLPSIAGCIRTGAPMLMEASCRSCGAYSIQSLFGRCCNLWIGCYHAPFQQDKPDKKFWTSSIKGGICSPSQTTLFEGLSLRSFDLWRILKRPWIQHWSQCCWRPGWPCCVCCQMSNASCYFDFLHFFSDVPEVDQVTMHVF